MRVVGRTDKGVSLAAGLKLEINGSLGYYEKRHFSSKVHFYYICNVGVDIGLTRNISRKKYHIAIRNLFITETLGIQ